MREDQSRRSISSQPPSVFANPRSEPREASASLLGSLVAAPFCIKIEISASCHVAAHVCTTLVLIALSLRGVTHASGHAPFVLRGNGAARGAKKSFVNHTSAAFYEALFEGRVLVSAR